MKKRPSKKIDPASASKEVDNHEEVTETVEKKSEEKAVGMTPTPPNDNMRELIEKNIKWSQVIYNQNKKINRRLTMMVVGSYIRLALVLAPIIIGILYLPPLLASMMNQYGDILGTNGVSSLNVEDFTSLLRSSK